MCCGRKNRAARYGGAYGYGSSCYASQPRGSGVLALIEGVQQMRLASQQRALATSAPAPPMSTRAAQTTVLGAQTQGVIYDDEKKQLLPQEPLEFEVLPTYQQVTELEGSESLAPQRSTVPAPQATSAQATEAKYVPISAEQTRALGQVLPARGLNEFMAALSSYKSGECGGYCRAKKVAKNLVRGLVDQEVARLEARQGGYLRCGQRKQIRREVEPVEALLKDAVKVARRERGGCC